MPKYIPFTRIPDPFYLNYDLSKEEWNRIDLYLGDKKPRSFVLQIASLVKAALKGRYIVFKNTFIKANSKAVFFVNTINQIACLKPLYAGIGNKIIISDGTYYSKNVPDIALVSLYSLLFLPYLLLYLLFSTGYKRKSLLAFFAVYVRSYGYYHYFIELFKKYRDDIELAVVSNDHSSYNRAFTFAATRVGIDTLYVQHASVSLQFPPLDFKYAFLNGMDELEKYNAIGSSSAECFLTGMMQFDKYVNRKKIFSGKIGICISRWYNFDKIVELIGFIAKAGISSIVVRAHASLSADKLQIINDRYDVEISTQDSENAFDFLKRVDLIISCVSTIILQAAMMKTYPVYYEFAPERDDYIDYYGYLKNGVVNKRYTNPQEVVEFLKSFHDLEYYKNTKHYCSVINTKYEGRSTELARDVYERIINNSGVDSKVWKPIKGLNNLTAYELIE